MTTAARWLAFSLVGSVAVLLLLGWLVFALIRGAS